MKVATVHELPVNVVRTAHASSFGHAWRCLLQRRLAAIVLTFIAASGGWLVAAWPRQATSESTVVEPSVAAIAESKERLARLRRFAELSDRGHALSLLGRIGESSTAFQQSLEAVGVWESDEWWEHLPTKDLSPQQIEELRWEVYRALIGLDGMLVKQMGNALGPPDGGAPGGLMLARRYLMTEAGFNEAKAALEVGRRIEAFRPSQAERWYSATSMFRLRRGHRLKASELGAPENAADGYGLAILCLLTHVDPSFEFFFSGYGDFLVEPGAEPPTTLQAMHETLKRAAQDAPSHYWTQHLLSHSHYWLAEAAVKAGDLQSALEQFELARKAFARCIEMRPDASLAYSDCSSVSRREAVVLRSLPNATREELDRSDQLIQASLDEARTGRRIAPDSDWVHWHEGLALAELNQPSAATDSFLNAVQLGLSFDLEPDKFHIRVDDLRGRSEAIRFAESMLDSNPNATGYRSLLAALHLSRTDHDLALHHALKVLVDLPHDAIANTVAGWCHLRCGDAINAKQPLEIALEQDPNSVWALMGLARAAAESNDLETALQLYEQAIANAKSSLQRASAWLGIAQVRWKQSANEQAIAAVTQARSINSTCDVHDLVERAILDWRALQIAAKTADESEQAEIETKSNSLRRFLEELSMLPIGSAKRLLDIIGTQSVND